MKLFAEYGPSRCEKLQDVGYVNLIVSILILVGILVSYLPQHFRIISRQTSEGISPYFILLGTTSGTCAFANILVLPASRADVACCKTVSSFECFAGLLGIAQVGVQWTCFAIILLLFLVFFPRSEGLPETSGHQKHNMRTAVSVAILCLIHGLVVIITSVALLYSAPSRLGLWANMLGLTATALAAVQYFPQIWTTYHLKHVGSLSIPMMIIQTPGSFLWASSLMARLGWEGWSTWGVFLVTGCLQGCLLSMAIHYELKARRMQQELESEIGSTDGQAPDSHRFFNGSVETDDEGAAVVENGRPSERTPLMDSTRKGSRSRIEHT